ncbi:MAG: RNA methyltransferase [Bacteroidota bacterium]
MRKLRVEELNRLSVEAFREAPKLPLVCVLDNIRSMHNVGSVFRTADAFRLDKLYLCGITPHPPHREIRKTAIGAEYSVAWEGYSHTLELVKELKNLGWVLVAAEQTSNSVPLPEWKLDTQRKYALILGHEIEGVAQEVLDQCDLAVEIPQHGTKHSLNISVAAGICLYHMYAHLSPFS